MCSIRPSSRSSTARCRRSPAALARPATLSRARPTPRSSIAERVTAGRLLVGTSGFAYPAWAPRFYPPGLKGDRLLPHYAERLPAVELNNTFYQQPTAAKVAAWLAATPETFRFSVKAQRGGSFRSLAGTPEPGLPWLTGPYRA